MPKLFSRLNASGRFFYVTALLSSMAFLFIYVNIPIALMPGAGHDDGLYISHAYFIASGQWLGPYSQFTLSKGPGYPLFLAATSLFRIPATLAQGVFYSSSVFLLSYVTNRILKSVFLSVVIFEVLLWNFGPDAMRLLRDNIYTPEFLIAFSLLVLALFSLQGSTAVLCASAAGLVFGWFWITREESVIAVPVVSFLFAAFFYRIYRERGRFRAAFGSLGAFLGSFALVLLIVATTNLVLYNTFAIVDIKGDFESALEQIESIKPDTEIPYVSVPKNSREKIYRISPTFLQLHKYLDEPGQVELWKLPGCGYYPSSCGDYATGWFMWAIRSAVSLNGGYSSAPAASNFYRKIHDEIKSACDFGIVPCYHHFLPFLPHLGKIQLVHTGASLELAFAELSFAAPPHSYGRNSIGTEDQVRDASLFVNVSNHTPPPIVSGSMINRRVEQFASRTKRWIIEVYTKFVPALLIAGICAGLGTVIQCVVVRTYTIGAVVGCAAWIAVALRITTLVLIDISAFPGLEPMYIGYAFPLSCYASIVSVFLFVTGWLKPSPAKVTIRHLPAPARTGEADRLDGVSSTVSER